MANDKILIKRGSRAQIEAAASIGLLNVGEPYLITDENKIAVGTSTTTFSESALPSDVTFETLSSNGDIGTASDQLAAGDHSHEIDTLSSGAALANEIAIADGAGSVGWQTNPLYLPIEKLLFDVDFSDGLTTGQLSWNSEDDTLNVGLLNDTILQIGQETLFHVENQSGTTIVDGTAVAYAGTIGNSGKMLVEPWDASIHQSKQFMGVVTGDILNEGIGYVTHFGQVRGIPTDGIAEGETWVAGDILYAAPISDSSPSIVLGSGLTNVLPEAPSPKISVAVVISAHSTNGTIFVRPFVASELSEDRLVQTFDETTLTDGSILSWNSTTKRFDVTKTGSLSTLRIGTDTDYSEFEADGTLVAHGNATYWVDVDFPIIIRSTGPNIPVLTTLKGNITAPQWDINDYSVCEGQEIPHFYKEGSPLYWHLHTVTGTPDTTDRYLSFEIEMVWANLDGVLSDVITLSSGDLLIPANTPQYTMKVFPLNTQSLPSLAIGAHVWTRLKRVASTGTAPSDDPWVTMLQAHIECDTFGSRQIGTK